MNTTPANDEYRQWIEAIKRSVREARSRAASAVNKEMLLVYRGIGQGILDRQSEKSWGSGVIERLSADLSSAFPGMKGFSVRNLRYMRALAEAWSEDQILQGRLAELPWYTHVALLDKVRDPTERVWYANAAVSQGWGRDILVHQIQTGLIGRQGKSTHNFGSTMPIARAAIAADVFKDPYVLDFVELAEDAKERHLEAALIERIREFLLELGKGFAFIGSQVHLAVGGQDFYIDLLFYHTRLHSHVVIDLKIGEFMPEYAGKMNFYLAAVDDLIATDGDEPSIGLLLCRGKNGLIVEYALRDIRSPIAVANYEVLPAGIRRHLPSPAELKRRFAGMSDQAPNASGAPMGVSVDAPTEDDVVSTLAETIRQAAVARGLDVPPDLVRTLTLYADETSLRAMIEDLDRMEDDVVGFVVEHGVDWPKHTS